MISNFNENNSRRKFFSQIAALPAVGLFKNAPSDLVERPITLPLKSEFEIKGTFINAAYTHPMSKGSLLAIKKYLDERMQNGRAPGYDMSGDRKVCKDEFAKMINCEVDELAWVASTMAGENFIVNGLSIPGSKSRVVTDAYHFHGSLHLYSELAKQGVDVHVIAPKNNRIELEDLEKAITPDTRLVALSFVSTINGFEHDLKKVCEIAHAKGALVYADIIQGVGAQPLNVKASGVDFCSTATYKWLMGDFGVGLLYVRKDRLDQIKRSMIGYRQVKEFTSHTFPFESQNDALFTSIPNNTTAGHFEVGTLANSGVAGLAYSLNVLNKIGIDRIQAHRIPMLKKLHMELPRYGFESMTTVESTSPIISFAYKNASVKWTKKLQAANVSITIYEHRIRISPSFFNDMNDIDKLIDVFASK